MIQKKYVTSMAQDAVKDKSIKQWALIKKVPGIGNPDNKINYMWVSVFENINQMSNAEAWWIGTEKKFGIPSEVIYEAQEDIERRGRYIYKTERQIITDNPGKYVILNWATPTDINKMIEFQGSIQKHFEKNIIKLLEEHEVAFDIGSYRSAPPGFRIWGGPTVENDDVKNLLPWLDWAYYETLDQFKI